MWRLTVAPKRNGAGKKALLRVIETHVLLKTAVELLMRNVCIVEVSYSSSAYVCVIFCSCYRDDNADFLDISNIIAVFSGTYL